MPTRPLQTIMTTANTVSRASVGTALSPSMMVAISATSMIGDGQRQQQRAVGLADPLGDHLGMMDGREYGAEQDHQQQRREYQSAGRRREGEAERSGAGEKQDRQHRENPRRSRHRAMCAHPAHPQIEEWTMRQTMASVSPSQRR